LGTAVLAGFLVFLCGLVVLPWVVAYTDLAGPYCEMHLMRPADTCSVLHVNTGRGVTHEHLNHPGERPPEMTLPSTARVSPEDIIRGVYPPAQMRQFHHGRGMLMLFFGVFFTLIVGAGIYREARKRRASTTPAPTPDE
jgi:hypothetical protein